MDKPFTIPDLTELDSELCEFVRNACLQSGRDYLDCSDASIGLIPAIEFADNGSGTAFRTRIIALRVVPNVADGHNLEAVTADEGGDPDDEDAWYDLMDGPLPYAETLLSIAENIEAFTNRHDLASLSEFCAKCLDDPSTQGFTGPFNTVKDGRANAHDGLYLTRVSNPTGTAVLLSWGLEGDFHRSLVIPSTEFYRDEDGLLGRVIEALESFLEIP